MKRWLLLLALLLLPPAAPAGETIAFVPGAPGEAPEVLSHVELKALISEFLDPQASGLGKSLGYLVWREVLSAISDQAGAGVILARAPGDRSVTDLLQSDYHGAALEIARHQRAAMLLWGRVSEEDGRIVVDMACTLLPEVTRSALKVRLSVEGGGGGPLIEAEIPRNRFSFGWLETSREALFHRTVITGTRSVLRAAPSAEAAEVARPPAQTALEAETMEGAWFRVRREDGTAAYVHADSLRIPPAEVIGGGASAALRARPEKQAAVVQRLPLEGSYRVLDARYLQTGVWYRLEAGGRTGWVEGWRVTPRFSLPAVHFMAGLYRYLAGRYDDAAREFEQFLARSGATTRNRVLATAYQLLAASRMLKERHAFSADKAAVLATLGKAAALTPYDPTNHTLQAVVELGIFPEPAKALAALDQALELDPADASARTLTATLLGIAEKPAKSRYRHLIHFSAEEQATLRALAARHRIAAPPPP